MTRLAFSLFCVGILSSCSTLTGIDSTYPGHWGTPKAATLGNCPDLSGSWTNKATATHAQHSLSNVLSYRLTGQMANPDTVKVSQDENQILVEFDSATNKTSTFKRTLRLEDDYKCDNGTIWLKPEVKSKAEGVGGYRATTVLGLRIATNGNLIGEERLSSVGAALWVIPVGGSLTFWFRWFPSD